MQLWQFEPKKRAKKDVKGGSRKKERKKINFLKGAVINDVTQGGGEGVPIMNEGLSKLVTLV